MAAAAAGAGFPAAGAGFPAAAGAGFAAAGADFADVAAAGFAGEVAGGGTGGVGVCAAAGPAPSAIKPGVNKLEMTRGHNRRVPGLFPMNMGSSSAE